MISGKKFVLCYKVHYSVVRYCKVVYTSPSISDQALPIPEHIVLVPPSHKVKLTS